MPRINVTQTFLPPLEEYEVYLKGIWANMQLTNQGPLLKEFELKAGQYLGVSDFHFVTNGTLALQIALRALDVTEGEVITTPFSFVATTSSILWERCDPVFVDIEPDMFCIDPTKIEAAISKNTKAILAVHVFGNPCDINQIEKIAEKHNLRVIYDAAHAFGVKLHGESILNYGDISTLSFHATKLFHTIEGGAVIATSPVISNQVELIKKFGFVDDDHLTLGINAKASEFQAAMGLCLLRYIDKIIADRKIRYELYNELIGSSPVLRPGTTYNYAYYPVVFDSEDQLLAVVKALRDQDIHPRRYFYPSLNQLPYLPTQYSCPTSERIARTILCLPLYSELAIEDVKRIGEIVRASS